MLYHQIRSLPYRLGSNRKCPLCGGEFHRFLSSGSVNFRKDCLCPDCNTKGRHRLQWLYLSREIPIQGRDVLHVAPNKGMEKNLRELGPSQYTSMDLLDEGVDMNADVTNLPFGDDSFDVVICSHVLEHVPDDTTAMSEFSRILRPGGDALLTVPLDVDREETFEDLTVTDPEERERLFGQFNHVRIYGWDYTDRLREYFDEVIETEYASNLSEDEIDRYAIQRETPLHHCKIDSS